MLNLLLAAILHLWTTTDEANQRLASTLPDREECHDDLQFQPYDCPDRARWALLTISNRESPGGWSPSTRWVGVHTSFGDHRLSARIGRKMRSRGDFQWWCPAHWGDSGFSTVGPHGLIYGFNVARLEVPGNCVPWQIFALPVVSATAALDRYVDKCAVERAEGTRGWCPRTDEVLVTKARWDERRRRVRRRARRRRCVEERGEARCRLN
jgi:hypothetical protein